jgi:hypothetical protein
MSVRGSDDVSHCGDDGDGDENEGDLLTSFFPH